MSVNTFYIKFLAIIFYRRGNCTSKSFYFLIIIYFCNSGGRKHDYAVAIERDPGWANTSILLKDAKNKGAKPSNHEHVQIRNPHAYMKKDRPSKRGESYLKAIDGNNLL